MEQMELIKRQSNHMKSGQNPTPQAPYVDQCYSARIGTNSTTSIALPTQEHINKSFLHIGFQRPE